MCEPTSDDTLFVRSRPDVPICVDPRCGARSVAHFVDHPYCDSGKDPAPGLEVDLVNHPPHHTAHPSGVECITITEHMGFNVGNAVKYLWRADEKGNALQDLEKALWYVQREIAKRRAQDAGT